MDEKIIKNSGNPEKFDGFKPETDLQEKETNLKVPVDSNALDVVESVELTEADEDGKTFTEKSGKHIQKAHAPVTDSRSVQGSTVVAMPPMEEMIRQTVSAIEKELFKTEDEMKEMMKSKSTSPHMLNNKVIRIRFLNGLLAKMKRVAKLTEDFIVGLWKQYVKRTG